MFKTVKTLCREYTWPNFGIEWKFFLTDEDRDRYLVTDDQWNLGEDKTIEFDNEYHGWHSNSYKPKTKFLKQDYYWIWSE